MRSSPLSLLGMFLLGACATVAVQSSASTGGDDPAADGAEGEPVAPHEPVPKWTVTQAEYAARRDRAERKGDGPLPRAR